MTRGRRVALAALVLGALWGCAREYPWPLPPADVHFGEDVCAHCRMIVSDDRFAAQRRARDGSVRVYDDLGCLLINEGSAEPQGVFVRAFDGAGWVRADGATIVHAADVHSPMGFGFAAFAAAPVAAAEAARRSRARVVSLTDLLHEGAPAHALGPSHSAASSSEGESSP